MTRVSRLGFAWAFISLIAIFCCHSLRQLWSGVGNHPSRQSLKERLVRKLLWKERFVDLNGGMVRLAGRRVCNSRMLYSDGSLGYQYSARHDSDGDFVKSQPFAKRAIQEIRAIENDKLPKKLTVPFWYEWEAPQAVQARTLSCNAPRTDSDRGMIIRWVD